MNPALKSLRYAIIISQLLVRLTDILVGLMSARDIPLRAKRSIPVAARVNLVKTFVKLLFVKFLNFRILSDNIPNTANFLVNCQTIYRHSCCAAQTWLGDLCGFQVWILQPCGICEGQIFIYSCFVVVYAICVVQSLFCLEEYSQR